MKKLLFGLLLLSLAIPCYANAIPKNPTIELNVTQYDLTAAGVTQGMNYYGFNFEYPIHMINSSVYIDYTTGSKNSFTENFYKFGYKYEIK